ncbi:hypothetical protein RRG08_053622 [Elysia crispata]|uniref:Uncharacterized protein n=1 Tax=Elysia crispata TaxID=231223 RepID=A0AAE0Y1R8_9GAST|nr:hypothetical protein RRG08_053622 [Elysia crispata]
MSKPQRSVSSHPLGHVSNTALCILLSSRPCLNHSALYPVIQSASQPCLNPVLFSLFPHLRSSIMPLFHDRLLSASCPLFPRRSLRPANSGFYQQAVLCFHVVLSGQRTPASISKLSSVSTSFSQASELRLLAASCPLFPRRSLRPANSGFYQQAVLCFHVVLSGQRTPASSSKLSSVSTSFSQASELRLLAASCPLFPRRSLRPANSELERRAGRM